MKRRIGWAAALLTLSIASGGAAAVAAPAQPDPELQPYVTPGRLVDVGGGRKIAIRCMGQGAPTVILSAGSGNWGETWHKIQPEVAKKTRVCTWDRAGFGFSSPSPEPQDVAHTAADLDKALRAAKIAGPYVLVGHSLGGLETLLFADRHRREVAGIVLEDPSFPGQAASMGRQKAFSDLFAANDRAGKVQNDHCLAEAKAHRGDAAAMDPRCPGFPPDYPPALSAALRPLYADPARWTTRASLSAEFEKDTEITLNPRRTYGAIPMIVLTATEAQPLPPELKASPAAQQEMKTWLQQDWRRAHDAMAALSTHGKNRLVPGTSHYIHLIKPQVVIAAIDEVVDAARRGRTSP